MTSHRQHQGGTPGSSKRNSRKENKPWITDDILDLRDPRLDLKKTKKVYHEAAQQYNNVNRNVKTKMKEAKEKCISDQCDIIEPGMKH